VQAWRAAKTALSLQLGQIVTALHPDISGKVATKFSASSLAKGMEQSSPRPAGHVVSCSRGLLPRAYAVQKPSMVGLKPRLLR